MWTRNRGGLLLLSIGLARAATAQTSSSDFRSAMRRLWDDHVAWTRLYIVSATASLPETEATANRLLQNQTDIGNAIKPYYGDAAGDKLTALLKEHITIAVEIVDAAKKSDSARQNDAVRRWQANADDIATFLSGANPKNWPLGDMKHHMRDHLDLTTAQLVAHLKKDWAADVAAYDRVHEQILEMADALSSGIMKQFPDRFVALARSGSAFGTGRETGISGATTWASLPS
jgi:hypothetical protein